MKPRVKPIWFGVFDDTLYPTRELNEARTQRNINIVCLLICEAIVLSILFLLIFKGGAL